MKWESAAVKVCVTAALAASRGLCWLGLVFASEAIQQDKVYFEVTIHSIESPVWVGVGRVSPELELGSLPGLNPTKEEQDAAQLWGLRTDSPLLVVEAGKQPPPFVMGVAYDQSSGPPTVDVSRAPSG